MKDGRVTVLSWVIMIVALASMFTTLVTARRIADLEYRVNELEHLVAPKLKASDK